ncbi:hypothetical protein [Protaetiibacter larvae]|uniref:Uncharacterized protein n=1 Tax=Protaetiibacter larvae TaxID=2592654 RepID=A0A5C1Y935_9MICO|nr:hypothetical protein [Protaetiibacter larvae]QEO09689.1 hypothetical protein FLP23_06525 [Protaetiibacter larvae]
MRTIREVITMRQRTSFVPDVMPHLSAGRHRNPRRGACFMEFASYLAGERWSDHPACTDRTLAALARGVNDLVDDERRDELLTLIPRVVGLSGGEELGLVVALRAATEALPVASMERQRVLAAGVLSLCALLEQRGVPSHALRTEAHRVLDTVPDAARWARHHIVTVSARFPHLDTVSSELVVATAVVGTARACIDDPDGALIRMLERAVDDLEALVRPAAPARRSEPAPAPLVRTR